MEERPDLVGQIMAMDTARDVETQREGLVPYGAAALPDMLACLPKLKRWQARNAVVYTAIKFARRSEDAIELGRLGLGDKSKRVRYQACALAAFSLDRRFLTELEPLRNHPDPQTASDARAATDAIVEQNHNLFMDRSRRGVKWHVGGSGVPDL